MLKRVVLASLMGLTLVPNALAQSPAPVPSPPPAMAQPAGPDPRLAPEMLNVLEAVVKMRDKQLRIAGSDYQSSLQEMVDKCGEPCGGKPKTQEPKTSDATQHPASGPPEAPKPNSE